MKARKKQLFINNWREQYGRVFHYMKPYKRQFATALLCMTIYGASDGAIPFLVKYVLDNVFKGKDSSLLYLFAFCLISVALIRAIGDFGQQYLMNSIGHSIVKDVRNRMNKHLLTLGPEFFIRNSSGDILSRVTGDVLLFRMLLTDSIAAIIRDTIRILVLMIAAFYLDPFLSLIAFVVFPIGLLPVIKFGKRVRKLSKRGQEGIGDIGRLLNQSIMGSKIVKIFRAEDFEHERFERENEKLTSTLIKSEKMRALSGPVNEVLASCASAAVVMYGGISVMKGTRTEGDFIAFLAAVFLLYDPFKKLSKVSTTIQQGMAGAQRVFDILDEEPLIKSPAKKKPLRSDSGVVFRNVSFKYPGSDEYALKSVTLSIKDGERVALVGFSGSGKSTLMDLIPRFIDVTDGSIEVGGVDVREAGLEDLRDRITMVTQHTFLFNDTIFNNVMYGNRTASQEAVRSCIEGAYARDFVSKLPKGEETNIGEMGHSLSGGERQRIAIARAMLKDSPLLLLDEATASLDNRAEREVQRALERLEKSRTSLIIAHRLSTIQNADRIIVMKDGQIAEEGDHQSLLMEKGEYYKLHSYQYQGG